MEVTDLLPTDTEAALAEEPSAAISDDDIQGICEKEYASGEASTDILAAQQLALKQFFLDPDGNEEEGRSQVQSSDVRDAILSAAPILMDMFLASESPVVFRPMNGKDVEQADQETSFCNYVLLTQNDGLLLVYSWWLDALLFKNGYVKAYWDAAVEEEREDNQGLMPDADPDQVRDMVAGLTAAGGSGAFLSHQAATAAATRADT